MTANGFDACLEVLAEPRRRELLRQLRQAPNGTMPIGDIVDRLYRSEPVSASDRIVDRTQLAMQLYHTDVPKLDNLGVVDYDIDGDVVRYRSSKHIETVLDSLPEEESVAN